MPMFPEAVGRKSASFGRRGERPYTGTRFEVVATPSVAERSATMAQPLYVRQARLTTEPRQEPVPGAGGCCDLAPIA